MQQSPDWRYVAVPCRTWFRGGFWLNFGKVLGSSCLLGVGVDPVPPGEIRPDFVIFPNFPIL